MTRALSHAQGGMPPARRHGPHDACCAGGYETLKDSSAATGPADDTGSRMR
jgi:hypothetical protein